MQVFSSLNTLRRALVAGVGILASSALTLMAVAAAPEDERDLKVEGGR